MNFYLFLHSKYRGNDKGEKWEIEGPLPSQKKRQVTKTHAKFTCLHFQMACPFTMQTEVKIKKKDAFPYLFFRHPAFLPLFPGFSGSTGTATSYRLDFRFSTYLVSSLLSGKPKGCILRFFASIHTINTSFLSLLFLVFSFCHIGKEKEDEKTRKNHLPILIHSYFLCFRLFLLSFKTGGKLFFLPSHSSVYFLFSSPNWSERENTREGGEVYDRHVLYNIQNKEQYNQGRAKVKL